MSARGAESRDRVEAVSKVSCAQVNSNHPTLHNTPIPTPYTPKHTPHPFQAQVTHTAYLTLILKHSQSHMDPNLWQMPQLNTELFTLFVMSGIDLTHAFTNTHAPHPNDGF